MFQLKKRAPDVIMWTMAFLRRIQLAALAVIFTFSPPTTLFGQQSLQAEDILKKYGLFKPDMTAQDYNAAGFRVYQKKNYREAAALFDEAIQLDGKHVLAHYNYACTLSLLFGREGKKAVTPAEIFHHLYVSLRLDPSRRRKALTDRDFDAVRDMIDFKVVTADPAKPVTQTIKARFTGAGALEYELSVHFTAEDGKALSFSDPDRIFKKANLYSVETNEAGFPLYEANKGNVGRVYMLDIRWIMESSDWSGMVHAVPRVLSINER
jgi:tetratricopeptide (TPR) repeat protein